jgi:hypothetical protein
MHLRALLTETGISLQEGIAADQKLTDLRRMYEPYVHALDEYLYMPLPPWFRVTVALDSWQTTAWDRITTGSALSRRSNVRMNEHF